MQAIKPKHPKRGTNIVQIWTQPRYCLLLQQLARRWPGEQTSASRRWPLPQPNARGKARLLLVKCTAQQDNKETYAQVPKRGESSSGSRHGLLDAVAYCDCDDRQSRTRQVKPCPSPSYLRVTVEILIFSPKTEPTALAMLLPLYSSIYL